MKSCTNLFKIVHELDVANRVLKNNLNLNIYINKDTFYLKALVLIINFGFYFINP